MVVLGIDTSDDFISVGLAGESGVIISKSSDSESRNKNLLHQFLDEMMKEAGMSFSKLGGVSVALGPGSFTGLRVGLAAAKGICWSLGLSLTGVSSLLAVVYAAKVQSCSIVAVKDAKRKEFYYAGYTKSGSEIKQVVADSVGDAEKILSMIEEGFKAVGPGLFELKKYQPEIFEFENEEYDRISLGGIVALLGRKLLLAGETLDLGSCVPNYVRIPGFGKSVI